MPTYDDPVTTDLASFGYREMRVAAQLLTAYCEPGASDLHGLGNGVQLAMNRQSGSVFLTDEDYNVACMNGNRLEPWLFTPYEGREGFLSDLADEYADMVDEDREYMRDMADNTGQTDLLPTDDDEDDR